MVEIVVSVAGKVADYMVAPVARQFSYLCNYRSNVDNLKKEFEKLMNEKERVQHLVNDAERNGEEIFQIVEKWLISVNMIIDEVDIFAGDEGKAKKQCLGGLCPDLNIRYQFGKKARKEMMAVTGLLAEGKKQCPTVLFHRICGLCLINFTGPLKSRMPTLNDILNVLSNPNINMIGVYGIGGVGKTTLVKEAARQAQRHRLFDEVGFAVVSQTPDVKKIQGEIADGLGLAFFEESKSGRARKLCARLKKEKKILIILDDIWSIVDLEIIGVPCGDYNTKYC
ncbi:hypothetical protein Ddye_028437 [Dipteronia dyeriana]|uniref:NB-ARC domain-containing protein n=1 Tax=Dipteronia dyeriana TaxID=168575 RepID=A0AAD9TR18_9ROSI|nr:hypothetical protein Ddye_028437 [Dipteronia dyeriana]